MVDRPAGSNGLVSYYFRGEPLFHDMKVPGGYEDAGHEDALAWRCGAITRARARRLASLVLDRGNRCPGDKSRIKVSTSDAADLAPERTRRAMRSIDRMLY